MPKSDFSRRARNSRGLPSIFEFLRLFGVWLLGGSKLAESQSGFLSIAAVNMKPIRSDLSWRLGEAPEGSSS